MRPLSFPELFPAIGSWLRRRDSNSYQLVYKTSALFYPIELRRKRMIWWTGRDSNSHLTVCKTAAFAELSYQPVNFLELRFHQNLWKPARELNPSCLSARRFTQERFRRPLSGTRAARELESGEKSFGGDGEIQTLSRSITNRVLLSVELHRLKRKLAGA